MQSSSRRVRVLGALAAVVVVLAAVWVVVRWRGDGGCATDLGRLESLDEVTLARHTPDDLPEAPSSMLEAERSAYEDTLERLAFPSANPVMGALEAFYPGEPGAEFGWEVPRLIGLHGDSLIVATNSGGMPGLPWEGVLAAIDLADDGTPEWVRSFSGAAAGGGLVDDRLVTLAVPEDRAPEVASIRLADGEVEWCRRLGDGGETPFEPAIDGSQTSDGDLVVARFVGDGDGGTERGAQTLRVDAASGDVEWNVTDDVPQTVRRQVVVGDLVVQGRSDDALEPPVVWGGDENSDCVVFETRTDPIVARSAADGSVAWTYAPEPAPNESTVRYVVGGADDTVIIAQATATIPRDKVERCDGEDGRVDVVERGEIVAVGADGEVKWSRETVDDAFPEPSSAITIAEQLVIAVAPDGTVGAWRIDDGTLAWRSQRNFVLDGAVETDRHLLVRDGGLFAVDLGDGSPRPILPGVRVDDVEVGDDRVVVRTEYGIAVYGDAAG